MVICADPSHLSDVDGLTVPIRPVGRQPDAVGTQTPPLGAVHANVSPMHLFGL